MPKIKVHEKALAHLSRGLYRSPASAIKELVSNAWDANATAVYISTGYPNFLQLSIQDNGKGFSREDFKSLMEGGIGNSGKQPQKQTLDFDRPTIGRLGIGMLGIAQICGSFSIISKQKNGTGFRANVRLYDLLRQKADTASAEVVQESAGKVEEVDVGEYHFEEFEAGRYSFGTTITSEDVHPTFAKSFQDSLKLEKFQEPPLNWAKALEIINKTALLKELGDYWRLLWELAATCPVPYVSRTALPNKLIEAEQIRLESYKFSVYVDGIRLLKPVMLSRNPNGYTSFKIKETIKRVYGRDLKYHGYLIVQEGKQLEPDELRGILIRVREVGVGFYDPSMLDYRINEGPRSRWLSGEIFVDGGLDDALNIDRDSFNRFHPAFRTLQDSIHDILQNEIFPRVYEQIEVRSQKKAKARSKEREQYVKSVLRQEFGKAVELKKSKSPHAESQVDIKVGKGKAVFNVPDSKQLKTKKAYQELAAAILTIYETSQREKNADIRREKFQKLLLELLSNW
jgi:hypothetical protein